MTSNLPNEQKTNWVSNEIVMPVDTNAWGEAINKLTDAVPLYTACGDFYTATYSNNAYILTPLSFLGGDTNQTVSQYVEGMRVVFKCPADNLGASTVNVNSLGNKSIKTIENVDVESGKLKQGAFIELRYDSANNCFKYIEFSNDKADTDLSNLTTSGENRLHALKGYLDEGELLTDAEGLANLKSLAHSTFDASKFTVIGSPTITDDGIMTENATYNGVHVPIFDTTKAWEFGIEFTTGATIGGYQRIASHYATSPWTPTSQIILINNDTIAINLSDGAREGNILFEYLRGNQLITPNTQYKVVISFNGTDSYTLDVYKSGELIITKDVASSTICNTSVPLFSIYSTNELFLGTIDLKRVYVVVDGVPVFTGTQGGTDEYPSNFTLQGSPTIDDDGVFTGGEYKALVMPFTPAISTANSWEIQTKYTYNGGGTYPAVIGGFAISHCDSPMVHFIDGYLKIWLSSNGTSYDIIEGGASTIPATIDATYYLKIGFTGSKYYIDYNTDGSDVYTRAYELTSSTKCVCNTPLMFMNEGYNTTTYYSSGTMDLNETKVIVNGITVWEPFLGIEIPYTLGKTGCKIVDSVFRTQVAEVYSREGVAPYHTLSDTDYTLPQGELYGMINKLTLPNTTPHIVETYVNGTSQYIVYSNGLKIQAGYIPRGSGAYPYVTLLKSYSSSDYLVIALKDGDVGDTRSSFSVSNKSTQGFTLGTSDDRAKYWYTMGY